MISVTLVAISGYITGNIPLSILAIMCGIGLTIDIAYHNYKNDKDRADAILKEKK
jgi:hypothetical protein